MKNLAWQELQQAGEQEPYLQFQGRQPLRLRMRPLRRRVLPIPTSGDPYDVEIKPISVAPLEIRIERIHTPQVEMPGLPPLASDILELEGLLAGLEHTISALGDGRHSSLQEGQAKVAEAQRQWEQMKAELEAHEIDLLQKQEQILGEVTNESKNWLAEEILANPTRSLAALCALVPGLPPSQVLPYIHRVRNTERARKVFEAARQQYEDGRTKKIAELEQESNDIRTKLRVRQEEDLAEILEIVLEPFVDSGAFPVEKWPEFESFLVQRRYAYAPLHLLEKAEQCYHFLDERERLRSECADDVRECERYVNLGRDSGEYLETVYVSRFSRWKEAADRGLPEGMILVAGCYEDGKGVAKDQAEAVKLYRKAAEQGNSAAQRSLGCCYVHAEGVAEDQVEAMKWFRTAAEQGNVDAQHRIGVLYAQGEGGSNDYLEAVKWYRKAAEQGHVVSQVWLGWCYWSGKGVLHDEAEAVKWYRMAADQGSANAQNSLGDCYWRGQGVAEDKVEAAKWYRMAAEQGDASAQSALGYCYYAAEGVAEDKAEAVKWYRKAAEQENVTAYHRLATCYRAGEGVSRDWSEAVNWLRKAAQREDATSQFVLGRCYQNAEGVPQDWSEAVNWYRKAAEQGNCTAQNSLGFCYQHGQGVSKDNMEAVEWFRRAAEQGLAAAQINLGDCYADGRGVVEDKAEAVKWYRKAAEQGHAGAQNNLGLSYAHGDGIAEDKSEAAQWYHKAADQGHAIAQTSLGCCYQYGTGVSADDVEAVNWYRKAAEQGRADAQWMLGQCYANGEGVAEDKAEAVKWYRMAAEQGNAYAVTRLRDTAELGNVEAQCALAECYDNGRGVATDKSEAVKWYRKAAKQGNADGVMRLCEMAERGNIAAGLALGECYEGGDGVAEDEMEAVKWYHRVAQGDPGDPTAQYRLGLCCAEGRGVTKDEREAVTWFSKAAKQGNASAQYRLGCCYDYGNGVAKDIAEAVEWYRKAADKGHAEAKRALGRWGSVPGPDSQTAQTPFVVPLVAPTGKELTVDLGGGIKLEMVLIPAGGFLMGSPDLEEDARTDEKPQHRVRITKPFYLGKYLLTQEQWEAVMGNNPNHFKRPKNSVEKISWDDCQQFLKKLNKRFRPAHSNPLLEGEWEFRLPSEAQWEYACRAGSTTRYCFGNHESTLGQYAWYDANSGEATHAAGEKKPNAWGLYDMHGSLWEWCQDWYEEGYYAKSPTDDPMGPTRGSDRVARGGYWCDPATNCRSSNRYGRRPGLRCLDQGFRVSLVLVEK
jgi:hypothetical protein